MNICIFTGRLVKDPSYRDDRDERPTLGFTLAINNGFGDKQNTVFMDCITSGKLADVFKDRLYKGVKIIIEGYLYSYTWVDKSGCNRHEKALYVKSIEIIAHTKAYLEEHKSGSLMGATDTEGGERYYKQWSQKLGEMKTDADGFLIIEEGDTDLPFL